MTVVPSIVAFVAAAGLLTITPGIDTALVIRTAAGGGARRAMLAAIGIGLGCLFWGAAVAVGLGALLTASNFAFNVLKWAGGAYLLWLGAQMFLNPRDRIDLTGKSGAGETGTAMLRRGFLANILNPKVGVFYVTFLPQFVPTGVNVALFTFLLAAIHVALGTLWFGTVIAATGPLRRFLDRSIVVKSLDRLTGAVLVTFGLKLALGRR